MNYRQAIKIMTDLVPKNIVWSIDLQHRCYWGDGSSRQARFIWLGDPIHKFFGGEITWQSAVDQALVALRDKGLIK